MIFMRDESAVQSKQNPMCINTRKSLVLCEFSYSVFSANLSAQKIKSGAKYAKYSHRSWEEIHLLINVIHKMTVLDSCEQNKISITG